MNDPLDALDGPIEQRVERNCEDLSDRVAECIRKNNSTDACSWASTLHTLVQALCDLRAGDSAEGQ